MLDSLIVRQPKYHQRIAQTVVKHSHMSKHLLTLFCSFTSIVDLQLNFWHVEVLETSFFIGTSLMHHADWKNGRDAIQQEVAEWHRIRCLKCYALHGFSKSSSEKITRT